MPDAHACQRKSELNTLHYPNTPNLPYKMQEILFRVEQCNISQAGYFVDRQNIKAIKYIH